MYTREPVAARDGRSMRSAPTNDGLDFQKSALPWLVLRRNWSGRGSTPFQASALTCGCLRHTAYTYLPLVASEEYSAWVVDALSRLRLLHEPAPLLPRR